jgi:hypothetical protein
MAWGRREREEGEVYGRRKGAEAEWKKGGGGGGGEWRWTEIAKWAGRAFFMDFEAGPA